MSQQPEIGNSVDFATKAEHVRSNIQAFIEAYMRDRTARLGLGADTPHVSVGVEADDTHYPYFGTFVKRRASFSCVVDVHTERAHENSKHHLSDVLRDNIVGMLNTLGRLDSELRVRADLNVENELVFKFNIISDIKYTTESEEILDLYNVRQYFLDSMRSTASQDSEVSISDLGFTQTAANMCDAGHELLTTLMYKARFKHKLEHKLQGYAAVSDANKRVSNVLVRHAFLAQRSASTSAKRVDVFAGDAKLTDVTQSSAGVGDSNLFHIAVPVHFRTKKAETT